MFIVKRSDRNRDCFYDTGEDSGLTWRTKPKNATVFATAAEAQDEVIHAGLAEDFVRGEVSIVAVVRS